MPNMSDLNETARRELHVFYVLDTSGSMNDSWNMTGRPISILNKAMAETTEVLSQMAKSNADALVKIAVLEFNSVCRWIQPEGPELMEDFIWQDLEAGGLTQMGAALKELNSKLSRKEFLKSMTGAYLPVIIFMTDGEATDNYKEALDEIRKNKWFARGTKIGFAIGEKADVAMIASITGSYEAVIQTENLELFARLLKFASVTASMVCSQSHTTQDDVNGATILEKAKADILEPDDIVTPVMPDKSVAPAPDDDVWDFTFDDDDFD